MTYDMSSDRCKLCVNDLYSQSALVLAVADLLVDHAKRTGGFGEIAPQYLCIDARTWQHTFIRTLRETSTSFGPHVS
jgi:hypothetical protein